MDRQQIAINYLKSHNRKTLYIPKTIVNLSGLDVPSTGFKGNVKGMRNLYWGHDCLVAMQSGYAYKLT